MAPRDPNVRLPRSVQQKVAEGESAFEQVYGKPLNAGGDGDESLPDEPNEPEDAGPIRPPVGDPPTEQPPRSVENEFHEPKPSPKDDSWEQRFKTLDGRFRAEMKRLNEQVKALDEHNKAQATAMLEGSNTITRLHRELEEARKAKAPTVKPVEVELELTPEEREQWSPEFLSVVKRAATAIVNAQMQGKEQEVTGLKSELAILRKQIGDVGGNSEQALHNAFLADMKREVPNFMAVNHSEEFISWLNEPDGYSMEPRKKALDAAVAVRNVAAAVRIFQGYLAELEATSIPPATPRNGGGRVRLETMAAPRTTRQHPQQTQEAPPPLTPAEISKFTADVTRGKYKGREQQQADFQKRIDDVARRSMTVAARGNPY